jgi:ribosome maturation factor RimP
MGFELVLVRVMGDKRRTLQVLAEPADQARLMTVEDCAEISHALSAVLDVADPIKEPYSLEVSSPGIDRPLVRRDDFARFAGDEAKLETDVPIDGRRRFTGTLRGLEGEDVLIESGGQTVRVPFPTVRKARLVLTDALLKRHAAAQQRAAAAGGGAAAGQPDLSREVS